MICVGKKVGASVDRCKVGAFVGVGEVEFCESRTPTATPTPMRKIMTINRILFVDRFATHDIVDCLLRDSSLFPSLLFVAASPLPTPRSMAGPLPCNIIFAVEGGAETARVGDRRSSFAVRVLCWLTLMTLDEV